MTVKTETRGNILIVTIDRPDRRNAVDRQTADALFRAFEAFDHDESLSVAILTGSEGRFCAGADLKAIAEGQGNRFEDDGPGPMGPTRMMLSKPVIAAIEGHAVAGGIELALWCDLRVASETAIFGVFCRRFGVPLIDGGTVRLAHLIGQGRALDMILTGRPVDAQEAMDFGLANRVVPDGQALDAAIALAEQISKFPQICMRNDRLSLYEAEHLSIEDALTNEFEYGKRTLSSGETLDGASRFSSGEGRGGSFD